MAQSPSAGLGKRRRPEVSIIVSTCDNPEGLSELLSALNKQTFLDFEVILLDAGRKRVPLRIIEGSYRFQLRYRRLAPHASLGFARSLGILLARGDFFVFVDDDMIPAPNWLELLVKKIREGYDMVWGRMVHTYSPKFREYMGILYCPNPSEKAYISTPLMPSVLIRRAFVLEKAGLLDYRLGRRTRFFYIGQDDADWILNRVLPMGAKGAYVPRAVIYHNVSAQKYRFTYLLRRRYGQGVAERYIRIKNGEFLAEFVRRLRHLFAILVIMLFFPLSRFLLRKVNPSLIDKPYNYVSINYLSSLAVTLGYLIGPHISLRKVDEDWAKDLRNAVKTSIAN